MQATATAERQLNDICVYCGSASGDDPAFETAARVLGEALADEKINLVCGGGARGLMGTLARAVLDNGGHVTGVIPTFLSRYAAPARDGQDQILVDDLPSRKRLMFERADAIVALPGGIGTLEELVEQLTWVQLEQHTKPILIADIGGFWRPLLALFEHMRERSFIQPAFEVRYLVAERAEDILPMIRAAMDRTARLGRVKETIDSRL